MPGRASGGAAVARLMGLDDGTTSIGRPRGLVMHGVAGEPQERRAKRVCDHGRCSEAKTRRIAIVKLTTHMKIRQARTTK